MVFLAGDFNFRPDQLGYHVIRSNANLDDAWITRVGWLVHIDIASLQVEHHEGFSKDI